MFKIKLTPYRPELGTIYHRQTKGHTLQSSDGRYQFYLDDEIDEADFWVVQGEVLEPNYMREEIIEMIRIMYNQYTK